MNPRLLALLLSTAVMMPSAGSAEAQERWRIDFENGAAVSGYNDVRIPGDSGTTFSLTNNLSSATTYFWRLRADVRLAPRHVLSALVAPLEINASGSFDETVSFAGATFAPGVPTDGLYVFNSYRLTYRYEPVQTDNWRFGFGVTVKVRDAITRLTAAGTMAEKTNVGVVPLVNFRLERRLGDRATFLLEGDALAAPQGRAEDVFSGVLIHGAKQWSVKAGYRFLEGGADNDEVYTFAMVHYLSAGLVVQF